MPRSVLLSNWAGADCRCPLARACWPPSAVAARLAAPGSPSAEDALPGAQAASRRQSSSEGASQMFWPARSARSKVRTPNVASNRRAGSVCPVIIGGASDRCAMWSPRIGRWPMVRPARWRGEDRRVDLTWPMVEAWGEQPPGARYTDQHGSPDLTTSSISLRLPLGLDLLVVSARPEGPLRR